MTTATEHSFILPAQQQDYRCGVCGTVWCWPTWPAARIAITFEACQRWQPKDEEGWFWCCGRRFRWESEGGEGTVVLDDDGEP